MIKRFCNFEVWNKTTLNLTRGGLRILATLALVLLLVGADPAWSAQAAPASVDTEFEMTVEPSATYVCVNQKMTIRVSINIRTSNGPKRTRPEKISGVEIASDLSGSGPDSKIEPDRMNLGFDVYDPNVAEFIYTAPKKPGHPQIQFDSYIYQFTVGKKKTTLNKNQARFLTRTIDVDVRDCEYKTELIFQQNFMDVASVTGTGKEIRLKADSDTHFSGSADFQYAELITYYPGCEFTIAVAPTKVSASADLAGDTLNLTFTIQDTTVQGAQISSKCAQVSGTGAGFGRQVSGSLASKGGVATIADPATFSVSTIIVERVPVEATAKQGGPGQTAALAWLVPGLFTQHP
jgi:hypothetical protein